MVQDFFGGVLYAILIAGVGVILFAIKYLIKVEKSQKRAISKLLDIEQKILDAERKILEKLEKKKPKTKKK